MTPTPDDTAALPIDEPELERLFSALADGMLSAADRGRLEAELDRSAAARRRYLEFMEMEFLLASEIGYIAAAVGGGDDACLPSGFAPEAVGRPAADVSPWSLRRLVGRAAAVLVIGVAIAAATATVARPLWRAAWEPGAARLTAIKGAVWAADTQPAVGRPVSGGPLRLVAGTAQITFPSGAVVSVQAPAAIEVLGRNRLFLRSGRVTPFVPPSAKGFTVVSPSGEVVDFGTEFSIDVTDDGKTDVFVISGEVAVAGGHGRVEKPMHLTQGFASRLTTGTLNPTVTLRPLVMDHFSAKDGPLRRRDWQAEEPSTVSEGRLWLPIDGRPHRPEPAVHTTLDHDFTPIVGRRAVISFKAWLPNMGTADRGRWVAFVIDDGMGDPPRATSSAANVGIMLSPFWRVGMRVAGEVVKGLPSEVFVRGGDGFGPYQVVMAIDDSPAAHAKHGHAVVTAMVNGLEFISDYPLSLPSQPRFSLHTFVYRRSGGMGFALIDDFSVSIDAATGPDMPEDAG